MTSLSSSERTVIQTMLQLNYSVRALACFINRSPPTISVEIHQVASYSANAANKLTEMKCHLRGRHTMLTPDIAVLKGSPQTASHVPGLSFKSIYN
ncbi:hypothetical protein CD198_10510 (plasmid) [Leuconostoc mesenteroides]|nr:hypothetical protein CD198_10510 [Leuconostoc mesenteroides]